jgi:hypothetical protein
VPYGSRAGAASAGAGVGEGEGEGAGAGEGAGEGECAAGGGDAELPRDAGSERGSSGGLCGLRKSGIGGSAAPA